MLRHACLFLAMFATSVVVANESPKQDWTDKFESQIAPLLARHCLSCHDAAEPNGGLDLSHKSTAFAGGDSGDAIVGGQPRASLVWTSVESDEMPHDHPPLSSDQKTLIKDWIAGGAVWTLDYIDPFIYGQTASSDRWISRLTVDEYIETVRATLGVDIRDEAIERLPGDVRADGFRNTAYNLTVDFGHVSAYAELADRIVEKMDVAKFASRFSKQRDFTDKNMRPLVEAIGRRVLRTKMTRDDIALYRGITTTVALSGGSFQDAIGCVLRAMLQSPQFLYRVETDRPDRPNLWHADAFEVANRLSYTLWGGPPDDALIKAAESNQLNQRKAIVGQIKRMSADPRCVDRSLQFATQWLNLDRLKNLNPNRKHFPDWSPELADDMRRETLNTFRHWVWDDRGPLVGLIDVPYTFASPALAQHYRMPAQKNPWARYDLGDVASRGGILTHGSLLTIGGDDASMVTRGLFVLQDLLLSEVGDPPPGLDLTPVPTAPGRTHRMVAVDRIQNEACGGCHKRFEPLAFGLERYDGLGTYRETDHHGNELRMDGEILFPGQAKPVAYESTAELAKLLATNDRVAQCLTRKVIQFCIARPLDVSDASLVREVHQNAGGQRATYQSIVRETLLTFP